MRVVAGYVASQALAWAAVAAAYGSRRRLSAVLAGVATAVAALGLGGGVESVTWMSVVHGLASFRFDAASMVLSVLSLMVVVSSSAYAWLRGLGGRGLDAAAYAVHATILGLAYAWSLPLFYIYWELMVIASTLLVLVYAKKLAVEYFVYMHAGSLALLVAIGYMLSHGAWSFSAAPIASALLATLLLVAFAVKLGVFPFHTWLPRVYTGIPEPAAAVVAGAVTSAGAYGLYRFIHLAYCPEALRAAFWLGVFTAAAGALAALGSNKLTRIAAYSSIGHGGYMYSGLVLSAPFGPAGALYLMIGHGVVKPLYFLVAHVLRDRSGFDDIRRMGLYAKAMPLTAFAGFVAALSLAGAPVFALFPGEYAVALGAAHSLGYLAAASLAAAAFLSSCYALRYWLRVFWHPSEVRPRRLPSEPPARELAPLLFLSGVALLLGLVGGLVIPHLVP